MQIARIRHREQDSWAQISAHGFELLRGNFDSGFVKQGGTVSPDEGELLAPFTGQKILAVGANFPDEVILVRPRLPSMFQIPPSALVASEAAVLIPALFDSLVAEGELALVISRRCSKVSEREAASVIAGYTVANDITGRGLHYDQVSPLFRKGCDTFLPLGPSILLGKQDDSWQITTEINGEPRQSASLKDAFFSAPEIVSFASRYITFEAGDVVLLGTPSPKPLLAAGDLVTVKINGIGELRNRIELAAEAG